MGEANPEAMERIARLTGHVLERFWGPDSAQCLRIGDVVMTAKDFRLWSDPSTFQFNDSELTVYWGGSSVTLPIRPD